MAARRAPSGANDARRKLLIKAIHTAKRELGMDDDLYRATLEAATGKTSCSDCTDRELAAALAHFRKCGFAPQQPRRYAVLSPAQKGLLRGIWAAMSEEGLVHTPGLYGLDMYTRKRWHVGHYNLAPGEASDCIEQLKNWVRRAGSENLRITIADMLAKQGSAAGVW